MKDDNLDLTIKKIIKYTIIFISLCIIIYASNGIINVKAKTFDYTLTRPSVYLVNNQLTTFSSESLPFENGRYYYTSTDHFNTNRVSLNYLTQTISFNGKNSFNLSFQTDDLVFFKGIIKFTSYYDISLVDNFAYIANLATSAEDFYNLYIGYPSSPYHATIEDFDMYITIDDDGEYAYNEVILFSYAVPFSQISNLSSLNIGVTSQGSTSEKVEYGKINGTIVINPKNYVEINQLVISDEEINMTLTDYVDRDNMIHYNVNDVTFPSINGDDEDSVTTNIIQHIASQISTGVTNFTRELWIAIKTLFLRLFVPSSAYFIVKYEEMKILFNQKFGVFVAPINIFIDLIERFLTLSNESTNNFIINVPEYTIPGFNVPILKANSYNLSNVLNHGAINNLWILYLDFIDCFLIISFLNFSWNKLSSFFGGMGADNTYYSVDDVDTYDKSTGKLVSSRQRIRTTIQKRRRNY